MSQERWPLWRELVSYQFYLFVFMISVVEIKRIWFRLLGTNMSPTQDLMVQPAQPVLSDAP